MTIRPRDEKGRITTNISPGQFITGVRAELARVDFNNWKCWECGEFYKVKIEGKICDCPHCGADPVPF